MPQAPQRLLLVISCYPGINLGRGGHYYTIRDLAATFAAAWTDTSVRILVIGDVFPPPLQGNHVSITQIGFAGKSTARFVQELLRFGDDFKPTHVHSFDNRSHFFGRWIARRNSAKMFLTRPGGPNSRAFFPYSPDIICFSEENMKHLANRRNLRFSDFHLLPQRVATPGSDPARIRALREIVGDGALLLRICRIGSYYKTSIAQTFSLAARLRDYGVDISAVVVGGIEDEEVLPHLESMRGARDYIVTDPHFTVNASELIETAQAIVGTGRSVIEGALLGKVLFTPLVDSDLPVLVTEENWRQLAATNFSERNQLAGEAPDMKTVIESLNAEDKSAAVAIATEMGIDAAIPRYEEIYLKAQPSARALFQSVDFALNSGAVVLRYISSRASLSKRSPNAIAGQPATWRFGSKRP